MVATDIWSRTYTSVLERARTATDEDDIQNAFLAMLERDRRVEELESPEGYMIGVVFNVRRNRFRMECGRAKKAERLTFHEVDRAASVEVRAASPAPMVTVPLPNGAGCVTQPLEVVVDWIDHPSRACAELGLNRNTKGRLKERLLQAATETLAAACATNAAERRWRPEDLLRRAFFTLLLLALVFSLGPARAVGQDRGLGVRHQHFREFQAVHNGDRAVSSSGAPRAPGG